MHKMSISAFRLVTRLFVALLVCKSIIGTDNAALKVGLAPLDRPSCQWGQPTISNRVATVKTEANNVSTTNGSINSTPASIRLDTPSVISLPVPNQPKLYSTSERKVDSSERLRQLRQLIASNNYDAYLVGPNDEHGSEYVTDYDRRLQFISGFSGSNGFAIIMQDKAILFTDGRYAIQAEIDLDCNWWLVVSDDPFQEIQRWLVANIPAQSAIKLVTDATLMSLNDYDILQESLKTKFHSDLILITKDLIDVVWNNEASSANASSEISRPKPQDPLFIHPIEYNGNVSWQEKVAKLVESMNKLNGRHYVVSKLEDIAWLLNLRGNDIPRSPLFKSYLFISRSSSQSNAPRDRATTRPLELDHVSATVAVNESPQSLPTESVKLTLYVDLVKIERPILDHLHVDDGTWFKFGADEQASSLRIQVELKAYDVFVSDFGHRVSVDPSARQLQGKLLLDSKANVAIHILAKTYEDRLVLREGLINHLKAVKNEGEVDGMRLAHSRDSLAISMLLSQLDQDIGSKQQVNKWTEVSASKELEFYRSLMDNNRGQSFDTISAYGANAAIVHYKPKETDRVFIGNQSTYLLDSGGQYLDGTTDITRTVHFGEPSEFQRETYTRVLMGAIDCMSLILFQPARSPFRIGDLMVRRHLMELGLDYRHGTGHGIGLFSLVHEQPNLIENYQNFASQRSTQSESDLKPTVKSNPIILQPNMFTSVEPGYYKENDFGIRLENIVVTRRLSSSPKPAANNITTGDLDTRPLLRFEPVSLVPFEPKLIKFELLSNKQKAWLNSYNLLIRLRMTQQINYYLNKTRQIHHLQRINKQPILINSTNSLSKLHQLLSSTNSLNQTSSANNQTSTPKHNEPESVSQPLDISKLQLKLEQTHKWIMSKTEIIPLDLPQFPLFKRLKAKRQDSRKDSNIDGQRLMLAYMSSLPFNDRMASDAIATLASSDENFGENPGELGGRSDTVPKSQNQSATVATVNTCSGPQCDLLLLTKLNPTRNQIQETRTSQNPIVTNNDKNFSPSKMQFDTIRDDAFEDEESQDEESRVSSIFTRFFRLNSPSEPGSWTPAVWILIVVASLLILQVVFKVYTWIRTTPS